ncbi:hypothetical protein RB287 [Rhodopirellula baltica SH 1]|uniref:Uncharacterized protein n=1 Tax=Rhodopirellula baltica (strain DSM 10527 / NCIMB 13988 / SH1) TaxID=243090 RepID=Q7UZ00_RHOBA|nr:hypothetical protein RB287 [Rhodopirellula baltica SH 1]
MMGRKKTREPFVGTAPIRRAQSIPMFVFSNQFVGRMFPRLPGRRLSREFPARFTAEFVRKPVSRRKLAENAAVRTLHAKMARCEGDGGVRCYGRMAQ